MSTQRVIVGLGNPGKKYEVTRHNMGYLIVQALAQANGLAFKEEKRFFAMVAKGKLGDQTVHLVLPTTYMNESGRAVRRYLDFYKLGPQDLLVVSDDIALPFGQMRLREKGGAGGHNGLKSIQVHLGTDEYIRLRMGISRGHQQQDLADYVLQQFSKEEMAVLREFIKGGATVVERLLREDINQVMNAVNTKKQPLEGQEKQQ